MKNKCSWKKATAFLMSMALTAGAMPVCGSSLFKADNALVANAESVAKAPAVGTLFKVGDTISITGKTYFIVDDDPNSGKALAEVNSDLTITGYENSDFDNQYIWKTGDVELIPLHKGFYITRKDASVDPEGFYIASGSGTSEDPFVLGLTAPKFDGRNITLNDGISMNFIVGEVNNSNSADLKVKLSGDCAEANTVQDLEIKTINGKEVYCATANVNASKMDSKITAELYYGSNEKAIDTLAFSVNDYLAAVDTTGNTKLEALVNATKQYGAVSASYFGGSELPKVKDHTNDILNSVVSFGEGFSYNLFKPSKMVEGETFTTSSLEPSDAMISLVLSSKLAVRLYVANYDEKASNMAGAEPMGKIDEYFDAYAIKGANDKYCFEIPNIAPTKLGQLYDINYLGTHYLFTPMAWAYRVMSKDDAPKKDTAMANALYEYYTAASNYVG
ncbi:hypothetical protein [Ruminococcus flavefaciens]|uniref:Uncharacterized protein n=1 Tax=Ruminococcus flavefaciens TaxID=1265 RepID=A0A1M7JMU6_RUMFL|nr:hypothetical protein [Ruminococcus flavefaciens]SHM54334.1 hypothetical protein SAMN04487860_106111 [Ruminococcus flavefaciens]